MDNEKPISSIMFDLFWDKDKEFDWKQSHAGQDPISYFLENCLVPVKSLTLGKVNPENISQTLLNSVQEINIDFDFLNQKEAMLLMKKV